MKILIAVVVLTALALAGSRRSPVHDRLPFAAQMIFTGSEFIVIGLLLGSGFLGLIDEGTLDRLRPFVCVVLGWIGFLFGLQFDRRTMSHLPRGFVLISVSVGLITMIFVIPPTCTSFDRSAVERYFSPRSRWRRPPRAPDRPPSLSPHGAPAVTRET